MSRVNNSSSSNSSFGPVQVDPDLAADETSPNYGKAALYIAIATVAAVAFAALIACTGGGIVVAGFMFSIGLAVDGVAILAGALFLSLFAGFMGYETVRLSIKADQNLNPVGLFSSAASSI